MWREVAHGKAAREKREERREREEKRERVRGLVAPFLPLVLTRTLTISIARLVEVEHKPHVVILVPDKVDGDFFFLFIPGIGGVGLRIMVGVEQRPTIQIPLPLASSVRGSDAVRVRGTELNKTRKG